MTPAADPVGTLGTALAHAARLLEARPDLAAEQAEEILNTVPGQPMASLLLARAKRRLDSAEEALGLLQNLCGNQPDFAIAQFELGLTLRSVGRSGDAIEPLRRAVALQPTLAAGWLALAEIYTDVGDLGNADLAYGQHVKCAALDPRTRAAGAALYANRLPEAESLLRTQLRERPADVVLLRMLAEVAARLRRYADAEVLLRHCASLAPVFLAARHNLALVLHRQHKSAEALAEIDHCLASEPRQVSYRNLKAAILGAIGDYAQSLELYRQVLAEYPKQAKVWMSFGHALKTAGHDEEGIAAYRRSIELLPELGEAYWSLANLKTFRFTAADVGAMHTALRSERLSDHERYHFHFALGKALEDSGDYEESFQHYAEGNRVRRQDLAYDADENQRRLARSRSLFTAEFMHARARVGCPAADPIFIVGLPRSGSTLLEQVLASHSRVEGTMELPDIIAMARRLAADSGGTEDGSYPGLLANLTDVQWRGLGEEYLARTRIYRKLGRPFFIDKMPNNFAHLGLILIALPNAKIIDARRHPLACCLSGFKQHFAMGQHFSYSLADIGRYYRDYVELMGHFDWVAPGRVHRVIYERMVEDTEAQVRALLAYCNLPFEPACLRFFENPRAVRTASAQQVRQPIFREGMMQWRHFEPWLTPLKEALGPVLGDWEGCTIESSRI
ncbi:MAG: tetratricopeptide repeat-containing sulfotransferase family protein [Steroidobacteraceae bacterium]